jgi:hypothetical protein
MKKIARHGDIDLFAPPNSRFSFLKSPYAAHKTYSAVDIYYGTFGSVALSPVDGEIIEISSFDTPTPFKGRDFTEYLIAIRQGKYVIKIIHIKPLVSEGEKISKGDTIGTFIKNGYFIFWNDPVMHVEVRKPDDYRRASNDLHLTPEIKWSRLSSSKTLELECRVEEVRKNYSLLTADHQTCGDVMGYSIDGGFIDGYIPLSGEDGFFGIIKPEGFFHSEICSFEVITNDTIMRCKGIGFSLSFTEPRIKVIPEKYGDILLSVGQKVNIRIDLQ